MWALLRDKKFLHAAALLVGTMVGVGIFGIPFVFAKAGFWVGTAWLVTIALVTIAYNLAFAELTLSTQGVHQISGYASIWLGPWARRLSVAGLMLSGYGTMLAYMIVAGQLLHNVLSQYIAINPELYSILFAAMWSIFIIARLRTVAAIDLAVATLFGLTIAVITAVGIRHIELANLQGMTSVYWFLPYGVVMFALSGANAIPLQRQLLAGNERLLKPAIIAAVVFAAVLYLVFAFVVVGVSGDVTTPDAVTGLYEIMGSGIVLLISLFGIMTISTSFLMMATTLYETFHIDYRLHAGVSWLLVVLPPLALFASGLRNFIDVIGLVGSVAVAILALVIIASYLKAKKFTLRKPEWTIALPRFVAWVIAAMFVAGIVYTFIFR